MFILVVYVTCLPFFEFYCFFCQRESGVAMFLSCFSSGSRSRVHRHFSWPTRRKATRLFVVYLGLTPFRTHSHSERYNSPCSSSFSLFFSRNFFCSCHCSCADFLSFKWLIRCSGNCLPLSAFLFDDSRRLEGLSSRISFFFFFSII